MLQIKAGKPNSEINVTPLVDVMLVLLIIFMVVTPMLQSGPAVKLPVTSDPPQKPEDKTQILVALTVDKTYVIGKEKDKMTEDAFKAKIAEEFQRNAKAPVVIKADARLTTATSRKRWRSSRKSDSRPWGLIADKKEHPVGRRVPCPWQSEIPGGLKSDMNVTPLDRRACSCCSSSSWLSPPSRRWGTRIQIPRESQNTVPPASGGPRETGHHGGQRNACPIGAALSDRWANSPPAPSFSTRNRSPTTDLARRMTEIYEKRKSADKLLFLAAEEKLNYEGIMKILDIARTAVGEDLKVGIVTDEKLAQVGG